jgi:thiamine biosynthesis lipoprotein
VSAAAAGTALRAVRDVMGMPVTVDVRDPGVGAAALEDAYGELRRVDALLSPFRADSEVGRVNRGELSPESAGPLLRQVLDLAGHYERATGGCFSCWLGGRLDPCGLVKGLAVDRVCSILERHGARNYLVDAGGDVVARGHRGAGGPWRVGIRHPVERTRVVRVVLASDLGVATSGTYEKGPHVLDPRTGRPATELLSLTVVGPDIVEADVHATAAFVMGTAGLDLIEALPGYEAYAIHPDLRASRTSGFDRLCDGGR